MFDPALVKKYLKQNNMTQADLARFTEKTPRTIARWLNPKEKIGREEP
jgi:transcriptional regulator with XRE-family HTH domain